MIDPFPRFASSAHCMFTECLFPDGLTYSIETGFGTPLLPNEHNYLQLLKMPYNELAGHLEGLSNRNSGNYRRC
jgi:hypothetical protein